MTSQSHRGDKSVKAHVDVTVITITSATVAEGRLALLQF
jgi:hypothetical protein